MKRPVFWIIFLCIILIAGSCYLFFFFPKFQVQTVEVAGNQKTATGDIQTLAFESINNKILGIGYKNIFTIDTAGLKKHLLASFAGIENIEISNHWFENIHLQITERKPVAVFCANKNAQNCYLIDIHGVAFEPAYNTLGNLIIYEGQLAMNENIMQAIIKVRDDLQNNFQIIAKEVVASNPLIVTTSEGWKIYFDPEQDIGMQITKMELLLKNEITLVARKSLNYIYLQYRDRAYYK